MTWVIGIDEAGYGPNLGPLVMSSVACRVPGELAGADLWQVLQEGVRRQTDPDDDRPVVGDSKVLYSTKRGLSRLEASVLIALAPALLGKETALADYVEAIGPTAHAQLRNEPWYTGESRLPVTIDSEPCLPMAARFHEVCRKQAVSFVLVRSVVVCPERFNRLLDHGGSKGAVLGLSLAELLEYNPPDDSAEEVHFFIDKHGGRNAYSAMLQNGLRAGTVVAQQEGSARSVYRVLGLKRAVRFTFQPRADAEHFCVALASMVSKYVRELLMREFNGFWRKQVDGLKPTAGYPVDAARFFDAIRPAVHKLGLAETTVWRRK